MSNSVIEEAKKRRLQKKEEEELIQNQQNNYNFGDNDFVKWSGITITKGKQKDKSEKVIRIVSDPYEISDRKPTDAKIFLYSEWLNDDESGFVKIIWPFVEVGEKYKPDDTWILTKLYNAIRQGEWVNYTEDMMDLEKGIVEKNGSIVNKWGKNGYWKTFHDSKQSFMRLDKDNNRRSNDMYPRSVYPQTRVLMNVIDRMDDWCAENKKTKALSSRVSVYEFKDDAGAIQERNYVDCGVPITVYTELFNNILQYRDHWNLIDAVIRLNDDNRYVVRDALEEKISEESKKIASTDPLTEEELQYEMWDFDERFKPCTYNRIKKGLLKLFKQIDIDLGTNFEEELNDLVSDEAIKFNEENKNKDAKELTQVIEDVKNEKVVEQEEVQVEKSEDVVEESTKRRSRKSVEKELTVESLPYWDKLDKEDKEDIYNEMESFEDRVIVFKGSTKIDPCSECKAGLPATVLNCPYCGASFQSE